MTKRADHGDDQGATPVDFRALARELAGDAGIEGLELAWMVRRVAHLYEAIASQGLRDAEVSGARLGLLIRLYAEERLADGQGVSPTRLSRCQRVSKNTVSSMLRGLEEQGLIERAIDARDKRVFRIRLSPAGQALVRSVSPEHFGRMNELVTGLREDERRQLLALLNKLALSLRQRTGTPDLAPEHP